METIWKEIESLPGYSASTDGQIKNNLTNQLIKPTLTGGQKYKRYPAVWLNKKQYYVHRLIAETFCTRIDINNRYVDHIDGNTLNNNMENLRWVSPSANTNNRNTNFNITRLTPLDAAEIRILHRESKLTIQELADMFKCSTTTVHYILKYKRHNTIEALNFEQRIKNQKLF
mgnify:CR=1 FL=1